MKKIPDLIYANSVIDAFGGVAKLAAILEVKRPRVEAWRRQGIPAVWMLSHGRKFNAQIKKALLK